MPKLGDSPIADAGGLHHLDKLITGGHTDLGELLDGACLLLEEAKTAAGLTEHNYREVRYKLGEAMLLLDGHSWSGALRHEALSETRREPEKEKL
jgi:hypothetical protein